MGTASEYMQSPPPDDLPMSSLGTTEYQAPQSYSTIQPWLQSQPFIIHDAIATLAPRRHTNLAGFGHDSAEFHQNLLACLNVGRLDRAEGLIRRLGERYGQSTEFYEAKKSFLYTLIDMLDGGDTETIWQRARRWFEVQVMAEPEYLDSEAFLPMFRGAFLAAPAAQLERTLRRYIYLADAVGPEIMDDLMKYGGFSFDEQETMVRLRQSTIEPQATDRRGASTASDPNHDTWLARQLEQDPINLRPVEQRGQGLNSLKETLHPLFKPEEYLSHEGEDVAQSFQYRLQESLEVNSADAAIKRWRIEHDNMLKMGINTALSNKGVSSLMWGWYSGMIDPVTRQLDSIKKLLDRDGSGESNTRDARLEWGPYIEGLPVDKLCATTILSVLNHFAQHLVSQRKSMAEGAVGQTSLWVSLSMLASRLGDQIESFARSQKIESSRARNLAKHKKKIARARALSQSDAATPGASRQQADQTTDEFDYSAVRSTVNDRWPNHIKFKISAFLISKFVGGARVSVTANHPRTREEVTASLPAFNHTYRHVAGKKIGGLAAHDQIVRLLAKEPLQGGMGSRLPMIVEPKPWQGYREGAYLKFPSTVVRNATQDDTLAIYIAAAAERGDLSQLFHGLDVLGKTAWRINESVLKVMAEVWNSGEALADFPPENPDIHFPPEPSPEEGEAARSLWKRQYRELSNLKSGYHSNRCFQNFQLEIAQAFRGQDIYFPHNIDFRGRAYPIPPLLNHMGSDKARALLKFAKGKELGVTGLRWLKIHIANLYGFDKASLKEREEFTMEHLQDVYDSATHPLSGKRWWVKAEDPWQLLGACMELKNALDSPDPHRFVSHVPVHQDGTCNGLQHYAALGGDQFGASQVNLEPSDRPQDVYTGVAELVKAEMQRDANLEEDCADKQRAIALEGKITRKVVKQTVMTNVYGVTFVGARDQVHRQLKEQAGESDSTPLSLEQTQDLYLQSLYVTQKVFKALKTMFQGAHAIQAWFGVASARICESVSPEQIEQLIAYRAAKASSSEPKGNGRSPAKSRSSVERELMALKSTIIWTSPLRVPVVQPYRKPRERVVQTEMQAFKLRISDRTDPVMKRRQVQGFPPNFIHSLDATHMLLSALKCHEHDLTFAAVHDSFWTHAADVPTINRVLRDAFVRMHQEDVIGRLKAEFEERYKGHFYTHTVYAIDEVGQAIRAWRESRTSRKNSKGSLETTYDELLLEVERERLLASEDPAERERGEAMETPASIFAQLANPASLDAHATEAPKLGEVSPGNDAEATEATEAEAEAEFDAEQDDDLPDFPEQEVSDQMAQAIMQKRKRSSSQTKQQRLRFWRPLTFPDVPTKGEFNVSRLKDSQYFFS